MIKTIRRKKVNYSEGIELGVDIRYGRFVRRLDNFRTNVETRDDSSRKKNSTEWKRDGRERTKRIQRGMARWSNESD